MHKSLLFVFVSVFYFIGLFAQEKNQPFEIRGKINADTGLVKLILLADSNFYPKGTLHLSAKVLNGKFLIKGSIPYPLGFFLEYKDVYLSDRIIVEPGLQSVLVNIDSSDTAPLMDNLAGREYRNEYLNAYKDLEAKEYEQKTKWD